MRRLERRDDTLALRKELETLKSFFICATNVLCATRGLEVGVLRSNARVVESSRDGVSLSDLAIVLQEVCTSSVENTGCAGREGGAVLVGVNTRTAGLDTKDSDLLVILERVEHADGVGATADASADHVRETSELGQGLVLGLVTDDALEVTHDRGERVRANGRTDNVVGVADVGDPVAHGLIDGILEGLSTTGDTNDLSTKDLHAENVKRLATHVLLTHVHGTVKVEKSTGSGGCDTMLTSTSLSNDTLLANALGEKALSESVVNLVSTGVAEVLTLEVDLGTAHALCEALSEVQRGGAANVVAAKLLKLQLKLGVLGSLNVDLLKLLVGILEGCGEVAATELTKVRVQVRDRVIHGHCVGDLERPVLDIVGGVPNRLAHG
mmetsp:Transcript_20694/g.40644  ORF Transcript_20694/g.40644 Transcript_20694/m.40644 type:complete len:382 (-) Transcript_20694:398-1543(-)